MERAVERVMESVPLPGSPMKSFCSPWPYFPCSLSPMRPTRSGGAVAAVGAGVGGSAGRRWVARVRIRRCVCPMGTVGCGRGWLVASGRVLCCWDPGSLATVARGARCCMHSTRRFIEKCTSIKQCMGCGRRLRRRPRRYRGTSTCMISCFVQDRASAVVWERDWWWHMHCRVRHERPQRRRLTRAARLVALRRAPRAAPSPRPPRCPSPRPAPPAARPAPGTRRRRS